MRVALLASSAQLGGAERMVLEVIHALAGCGVGCSLIALEPGPLLERARAAGAERADAVPLPGGLAALGDAMRSRAAAVRDLVGSAALLPSYLRRFRSALRDHRPDVIHSHGIKTHVLATLLPAPAPVVWHLHDYVGPRPAAATLLRGLARRCRLVLAVSESVAHDARGWLPSGVDPVVVHNSVDTRRFAPDGPAADLDAAAGLPPAHAGTLRIGLPATFARWKGHDLFLKALARLERRDVRGYIIGGPIYQTADGQWQEPELRRMTTELGLDGRVGLTGFIEDMPAVYRALDVVMHASTRPEPFGLVVAEAMATGRAVMSSGLGGAAELFEDQREAIRFPDLDPDRVAGTLAQLLSNAELRAALGRKARKRAVASFDRAAFARALLPPLGSAAAVAQAAS